jgi:hypothetical protein
MKSNIIDIDVQFRHQTDGAVCVGETEDGPDIWIPHSRCEIYPQTPVRGQYITLTSDDATLTEKGLT